MKIENLKMNPKKLFNKITDTLMFLCSVILIICILFGILSTIISGKENAKQHLLDNVLFPIVGFSIPLGLAYILS